jgi:hypothetical protein
VALRHAVLGCVCVWVLNMKCAESGCTGRKISMVGYK